MEAAVRLRIIIYGNVQGVFFRAGVQSEARRLGLRGWVRNLPDGSVEAVAEGERKALEKLLEWCGHGPDGASVSEVRIRWEAASGKLAGFRITY